MKRSSMACAVLAGAAIFSVGCASQWAGGLPGDEWQIGGGVTISWTAPTSGTAVIADKTSGKIVMTRSLKRGEKLEFSIASAKEFETATGVPLREARIVAYFVPSEALPPARK